MEEPLKDKAADEISELKHDLRNQLSNIYLAIDQLRYEISESSADGLFYIETIVASCEVIKVLLKDKE